MESKLYQLPALTYTGYHPVLADLGLTEILGKDSLSGENPDPTFCLIKCIFSRW